MNCKEGISIEIDTPGRVFLGLPVLEIFFSTKILFIFQEIEDLEKNNKAMNPKK